MSTFPNRGIYHVGTLFCRYEIFQYCLVQYWQWVFRFVYMRYANDLLKEGRKLLHWLTHIFVGAFIMNLLLIWPVKYIWRDNNYQDSVKGKLCMKANFTSKFGTDVELSLKPFLILISLALVFSGLMHFYFFSSLKIRYHYLWKLNDKNWFLERYIV